MCEGSTVSISNVGSKQLCCWPRGGMTGAIVISVTSCSSSLYTVIHSLGNLTAVRAPLHGDRERERAVGMIQRAQERALYQRSLCVRIRRLVSIV